MKVQDSREFKQKLPEPTAPPAPRHGVHVHNNPINHVDPLGLVENKLYGPGGETFDTTDWQSFERVKPGVVPQMVLALAAPVVASLENYQHFDGNVYNAANATLNPMWGVVSGAYELSTGRGLNYYNIGQNLSPEQKKESAFNIGLGIVGTSLVAGPSAKLISTRVAAPAATGAELTVGNPTILLEEGGLLSRSGLYSPTVAQQLEFNFGAVNAPVTATAAGESFIRAAATQAELKLTIQGGLPPNTYAFPRSQFQRFKGDLKLMEDLGDLPGGTPQFFKELQPPAGTPVKRGLTPPRQYGGRGFAEEALFPEGF